MTQWGLDTLFNPAKRHMDEEKRRLQSTREEIGDSSGGKRIDLESGKVTISRGAKPAADAEPETESESAESAETQAATDADAEAESTDEEMSADADAADDADDDESADADEPDQTA